MRSAFDLHLVNQWILRSGKRKRGKFRIEFLHFKELLGSAHLHICSRLSIEIELLMQISNALHFFPL